MVEIHLQNTNVKRLETHMLYMSCGSWTLSTEVFGTNIAMLTSALSTMEWVISRSINSRVERVVVMQLNECGGQLSFCNMHDQLQVPPVETYGGLHHQCKTSYWHVQSTVCCTMYHVCYGCSFTDIPFWSFFEQKSCMCFGTKRNIGHFSIKWCMICNYVLWITPKQRALLDVSHK